MAGTVTPNMETSEAAIFARLWEAEDSGLSPVLARHLLKLEFSEADRNRMRMLAEKNRTGRLTPQESQELDNFIKVGDLVAILQSKARQTLKIKPSVNHG